MTKSVIAPGSLLSCYIPFTMLLAGNFSDLLTQPFQQKQVKYVNYRIVFWI